MKRVLLISIAAFTVACDGSHQTHTATSANATGAGSSGARTSAPPASDLSSSTVTLVGCLQGSPPSAAPGTSAAVASDRASAGNDARQREKPGAASTRPFVLANAVVESGGVGANEAGGSGRPVASTGLSFELDGVPADAHANVNKLVRVTGRLARPAPSGTSGTAAARGGAGAGTASSTTGETSPRDDVRANSTGVAGDSTNHRLTVETVQVVASQCGPQ